MKRVIYSVYVNVPPKEHFGNSKNQHDTVDKANVTINAFEKHYDKLVECKLTYAEYCESEFIMFTDDEQYRQFKRNFLLDFPELTEYEVINFYKIHLLTDLARKYDEILYLDFDVVPLTDEVFFDVWDLSKGICVYNNNKQVIRNRNVSHSIRSPSAKYFNCQAMLIDGSYNPRNDVINTGIIGARKEDVISLDYFGKFKDTIDLMTKLRTEENDLYPQNIIDMFRYDNETIFSYKREINNINIQWLDDKWHYFFDKQGYIPRETRFVHAICKDFDKVWERYD
tara:strand:- start:6749 stop:7597 length:849 start_codon:yes stop_codon:yes gene_type:complete